MDASKRSTVRDRAGDACEYCGRRASESPLIPLQIEHVIPRKHGGGDDLENLALSCAECNLHKGSNLTGIDPETDQITPLFDPRRQLWADHFEWQGLRIVGRTPIGRTTVRVMEMNTPSRMRVRMAGRSK